MPSIDQAVRELEYETYQSRQFCELHQGALEKRAEALRVGQRAVWTGQTWTPKPYKGFALQAMLNESSNQNSISLTLQEIQHQLIRNLSLPGALYPLPATSFHQTVANTFSADRLESNISNKGLESEFPQIITKALRDWEPSPNTSPPKMRLIGVALFGTAIGVLGTFDREQDFQRIINFRNFFYSHPDLSTIGLKRTRPFIGHLTIAYCERALDAPQKGQLTRTISVINERIQNESLVLEMPFARLHSYETLSAFSTFKTYPTATL